MIPTGALLSYTGTWSIPAFTTTQSVIDKVSADLAGAGLPVRNQSSDATYFGDLSDRDVHVKLDLQVTGQGYDSPDDVTSIVRHFVYQELGHFPSADSIPYVTQPDGSTTTTGQPAPPAAPKAQGCIAGAPTDTTGAWSLSCWFGNLTNKGLTSVGFIAILGLLGIGLLIFTRPAAAVAATRGALGRAA